MTPAVQTRLAEAADATCSRDRVGHEYNLVMARGWESKSVEAQQAEAGDKQRGKLREKMTPEQAAAFRERETLRLSRQQVLQQLQASSNPRHRKLLEETLVSLDEKLKSLEK